MIFTPFSESNNGKEKLPNKPFFSIVNVLGFTSVLCLFVEGLKLALPYLIPSTQVSPPIMELVASKSIILPSVIAHVPLPFIRKLPMWFVRLGDLFLVTKLVTMNPITCLFTVIKKTGLFAVAKFTISSCLYGIDGTAVMNISGLGNGVPYSPWLHGVDGFIRVVTQFGCHSVISFFGLCIFKGNPFSIPRISKIAPPNAKDIIVEISSKMNPLDYMIMLFLKFGLPVIGILLTINVIYSLHCLQIKLDNEK